MENLNLSKSKTLVNLGNSILNYFGVTPFHETLKEADEIINDRRQIDGFEAASKKFKAGKMNKAGEVVKPDTWTVVIKLNH